LELFQFTNPGTKDPAVLELGGKKTLRLTLPAGSGDMDYFAFIPAPDEAPKFTSIVRNANGSLTLTWTGGGKLQSAASLKGPWTDVAGAASPLTLTPNADAQFARIVK
jgi:hypothetical protein